MNLDDYQKKSRKTAVYPNAGSDFVYVTMGLASEAGEVAGKLKKVIRDKGGVVDQETKEDIKKELGDVLWYVAQLATELGLSMDEIAVKNIEKLYGRMDRGVLGGDGDNR
jgi:NTP pyrophosphatase (non-canonical NTP hydrolase)